MTGQTRADSEIAEVWMPKVVLRGRSDEVAAGVAVLRRASRTGQGGVLLVQGPGGIGKSALLAELVGQARAMGIRCSFGKADQITRISPAAPLLLALRAARVRVEIEPRHRHRRATR